MSHPVTATTSVPVLDTLKRGVLGVIAWLFALLLFFPIFWMTITAFKTEQQAYSSSLIFAPTLDSFREVFARSNYFAFAWNSILISVGVTVICLLFAALAKSSFITEPTERCAISSTMASAGAVSAVTSLRRVAFSSCFSAAL